MSSILREILGENERKHLGLSPMEWAKECVEIPHAACSQVFELSLPHPFMAAAHKRILDGDVFVKLPTSGKMVITVTGATRK